MKLHKTVVERTLDALGLVDQWIQSLEAKRGLATSTRRHYRLYVERFLTEVDKPIAEVKAGDFDLHLREMLTADLGTAARKTFVAAVRSFFAWAHYQGELEINPARALRGPRTYRREQPVLSVEQTKRLIYVDGIPEALASDPLEARDQMIVAMSYLLALRISEPARLRTDTIRFDEAYQTFSVLVEDAKGARGDVRMALHDRGVSRMLARYLMLRDSIPRASETTALFPSLRGGHLSERRIRDIFQSQLGRAGLGAYRKLTFHVLRRSLATQLHERGVDIVAIRDILRHAHITTTARYISTSAAGTARAWRRGNPLRNRQNTLPGLPGEMARNLSALRDLVH